MPTYVTFFSYTGGAWEKMIDTPENRAVAARKLIEQVGGRMVVFYWMFGEWDGLVIYEVGSPSMAATLSAVATSSGLIERVKTNQLLESEDVRTALTLANAVEPVYVPPGRQGEWFTDYDALG